MAIVPDLSNPAKPVDPPYHQYGEDDGNGGGTGGVTLEQVEIAVSSGINSTVPGMITAGINNAVPSAVSSAVNAAVPTAVTNTLASQLPTAVATAVANAPPPPSVQYAVQRPRYNVHIMRRAFPIDSNNAGALHTNQNLIAAESAFDAVRLGYFNGSTAAASVIQKAAVNVTSAPGDEWNLTNGNAAWTAVTFAGAASLTVPAATFAILPTYSFSDWISINSIARTDNVNALPLLAVRSVIGASIPTPITGNLAGYASINEGRLWTAKYMLGDAVADPALTGTITQALRLAPLAVQFRMRTRGLAVMGVGDSVTQGLTTTSDNNSWGFRACKELSTAGFPVSWYNQGHAGMASWDFPTIASSQITLLKPDVCFIQCQSGNDGTMSATTLGNSRARALGMADLVIENRGTPVLVGAQPRNASGASETARLAHNDMLRTAAANGGIPFLDLDTILRDPGNVSSMPASSTNDGIHPNNAGTTIIVPFAKTLIRNIMLTRNGSTNV
jgi:lysophospholipase L1-like esterase